MNSNDALERRGRSASTTATARARETLAAAFAPRHDGTGVALDAAVWIVTARRAPATV